MRDATIQTRARGASLFLAALLGLGCLAPADPARPARQWDLFLPDEPGDPLAARVRLWQASERLEAARQRAPLPGDVDRRGRAGAVAGHGGATTAPESWELARAQRRFRAQTQTRLARETLSWVQQRSRQGYRPDRGGDRWPLLRELLESGRDDCDGWELLTFSTLRALGFAPGEIYRAVVRQVDGEGHHMVTLWFPEGAAAPDPWVLDPTGSISKRLVRLSTLSAWEPVRLFDETDQFRAAPLLP